MTFIEHYRENRQSYRGVLFDIDGTLLSHGRVAQGVPELLAELDKDGVPYLILTNDAMHTSVEKSQLMQQGGLTVDANKIISCGDILHELVERNGWQGKKFFLLGRLGEPSFAEKAGLEVCRDHTQIDECFGVLNGEGYYDWHDHMQAVICFFRKYPNAPFVVPNPDSYWPGANGIVGVGAGGQARFICGLLKEMHIEVEPIYLGKPYAQIFNYTVNQLKKRNPHLQDITNDQIIMLGDSLKSDIPGANQVGLRSGVMLTGITTPEMIACATGAHRPEFVFDTMG